VREEKGRKERGLLELARRYAEGKSSRAEEDLGKPANNEERGKFHTSGYYVTKRKSCVAR